MRRLPRKVPRRTQEIAAALAVFLLLAGPPGAAADAAAADKSDAAARGAYLAAAAGCDTCHTDSEHGGQPYAGGRRLATEFGPLTTPNLTPDRATGIGGWSTADFVRAMRWGIAPDDSHYVPAFPFPFYNGLSERDLTDIKAHLDALPAVSRPAPAGVGAIALWARARAAVAVAATRLPGPWQAEPSRDPEWNRGAYLAATIGRCGDCHTPRTLWGAPDPNRRLAGAALPGGKKGPNITPDKQHGIGNWSRADILNLLSTGQTPDFDFVGGAMAEIVKNTSRLTDADRRAIVVFLQSVPAVPTPGEK